MVHDDEVSNLKESIKNFNNLSSIEKKNLIESIEMLWLNASVKKKKKDINIKTQDNENIVRIRQLFGGCLVRRFKRINFLIKQNLFISFNYMKTKLSFNWFTNLTNF